MTRGPENPLPAETADFDLSRFLPYRLSLAAERTSAGLARLYRSEFGITNAEWRVLAHLADAGEVSVRDLERRVNLEKSKASRAATRLAAQGYVTKAGNVDDRRLISLSLSAEGRELMAQLIPLATEFQRRLESLLADDLARLEASLEILANEEV